MQQIPILTVTRTAAGAIPVGRFVTAAGALCGAGAAALGVSDAEASAAGKLVPVVVLGTKKVQVGAAVAVDALVKSDAAGKAIPQGGAGVVLGRVLVAQATIDGFAEILLLPPAA